MSRIDRCEKLLDTAGVAVLPFDRSCARVYARLCKDRTLKPPDAIQLACAPNARCDLFITNDERLSPKIVPGIQFIASLDRAFVQHDESRNGCSGRAKLVTSAKQITRRQLSECWLAYSRWRICRCASRLHLATVDCR